MEELRLAPDRLLIGGKMPDEHVLRSGVPQRPRRRDDLDRVLLDPEEVGPRLEGGANDRAERAAVLRREHVSDVMGAKPACQELPKRAWVAAVHVRPAHL